MEGGLFLIFFLYKRRAGRVNLSYAGKCENTGCSHPVFSATHSSRRKVSKQTIFQIARILDWSVQEGRQPATHSTYAMSPVVASESCEEYQSLQLSPFWKSDNQPIGKKYFLLTCHYTIRPTFFRTYHKPLAEKLIFKENLNSKKCQA